MTILLLEECSFRALPALETHLYDGWVIRSANGFTRRSNSVNPVYESRLPLEEKITYYENYCAERGIPTHFRLTPIMQPPTLEAALQQRGYSCDGIPTHVQTANLSNIETQISETAEILPLDTWFDRFSTIHSTQPKDIPTFKQMLAQIEQPLCALLLTENRETVAAGLGVLDSGYIGLFDIVVRQDQRGRGLSKPLVSSLLEWGKQNGAHSSYLQVMANNTRALNLYQKFGYETLYSYWYWSKT